MTYYKINTPPRLRRQNNKHPESAWRNRVEWIDTLKVLTMILVIMGHCTYYTIQTSFGGVEHVPGNGEYSFMSRLLVFASMIIYKFHMPLFMAVSGAVFSWTMGKFDTLSQLLNKKAKRLLLPFLLVTTFISVPLKYAGGYYAHSTHVLWDILCGQYLLLGNSHLWFVVSLFYIYVIFYVSGKISHSIPKNHLYWCSLLGLSWFALGLAYFFGGMLGITGALRHLLFFALGFSTFKYWDERESLSAGKQILSWVGFIATVAICVIIPKCIDSFAIKAFLRLPVDTVFALWGCVNMVFLAKSINQCAIIKNTYTYRFMNRYNYELYLYSDPFNYVLIALLVAWFGQNLFTSDVDSLLAYMIRFFGTILGAAFIIGILYMLKTKRKRLFFNKI